MVDLDQVQAAPEPIIDFITHTHEVFYNYQPLGMGALKFHLLEHLTENVSSVWSVEYLHAGLYEAFPENSKRLIKEHL